jgi:ABC-type transport system involved in multi-copper enzyme maturation permease subunit
MAGFLAQRHRNEERLFGVLFKKELMENIHNYRFLLALTLCLVIIPLGFYVAQKDYAARRQAYEHILGSYEQSHKTIFEVMFSGAAAFRPPAPLALLSAGIEKVLPNSVETRGYVSQESRVQDNNTRRLDSPFASLFGGFDLAFIISTVMTVLVMIFTFNAVAGERERGTLAQVMSNPVPRPTVIAAKLAAGSSLLAFALLAGTLAGSLLTAALDLDPFRQQNTVGPFLIAIGISVVFLFVMYNFGLLISSLSRSSISAMVNLLFCWVVLAMLVPKASVAVARLLRPVQSQEIIDLEKSQVRLQLDRELHAAVQNQTLSTPGIKDMSYEEYARARPSTNPAVAGFEESQKKMRDEFKKRLNAELDKIDADYERQKIAQAAVARNLSRISPISCLVHVLTELAGTGFVEVEQWRNTRSRLQQIIDREITSKMRIVEFQKDKDKVLAGISEELDRNAPAPAVLPLPIRLAKVMASISIDLLLLMVYGVIFYAGAYVSFLRYDVR